MRHFTSLLSLCLLLLLSLPLAAQDFKVDKFRENTMDMSAATSGVKDLNGTVAALIRFVVRDDKFEFTGNLGELKKEQKTGELWLFVPQGTKRVTISHPVLGVLRGYELPEALKSKTTYDAEVVITNETYLQLLMQQQTGQAPDTTATVPSQPIAPAKPIAPTKPQTAQADTIRPITPPAEVLHDDLSNLVPADTTDKAPQHPKAERAKRHIPADPLYLEQKPSYRSGNSYFALSAAYCILGVKGITAAMEVGLGKFVLEAGGTLGAEKAKQIGIFYNSVFEREAYDYSSSNFFASMGCLFNPKSVVQVTLQGGASLTTLSGSLLVKNNNGSHNFNKAHATSAFVALRLALRLGKHFLLYVTPQYAVKVENSKTFDVIKEADDMIGQWADGFGLKTGLSIKF